MSIIQIVFVLCILGFAWWVFSRKVLPKVPDPFNTVIVVFLAFCLIFWLLQLVGVIPGGPSWRGLRWY